MTDPINAPFVVDQDELLQIGIQTVQAGWPQWKPNPAAYDYRFMSALAAMVSAAITPAANVPPAIIRYVGTTVYRTPPFAATAATVTATVAIVGTGPETIPAGSNFGLTGADGTPYEFVSTADVLIADDESVSATGAMTLICDTAGSAANGLGGTMEILDRLAIVDTVTTVGLSAGGLDEEGVDAYTARVQQLALLIKPSVVLPPDFAAAARLLVPGVQRALAVDGLNASTGDTDQERCMTVFPIDAAGADVPGGTATLLQTTLANMRETTFLVFVDTPTRTVITVAYAAVASANYDPAAVKTQVDAALAMLLSPATHGIPRGGDLSQWIDTPVIRYQRVVQAVLDVDGIDHYTTLTVNGGTADVTLTGPAALPTPTITGTVT